MDLIGKNLAKKNAFPPPYVRKILKREIEKFGLQAPRGLGFRVWGFGV